MLSTTEENYMKAILQLLRSQNAYEVGVTELASHLGVRPATVTDMLKKLKKKDLIHYEKYGKITITQTGRALAVNVLRKHRLWETFLHEKLDFSWDEVHEVAEQLEHIKSIKLINKLDEFLGYPKFDPHGDAIPTAEGAFLQDDRSQLSKVEVGGRYTVVGVRDSSPEFLKHVGAVGFELGNELAVLSRNTYDGMMEVEVNGRREMVSEKVAENLYVVH